MDYSPDLVGISFEVFRAYRAYDIADHYRKRLVPVVLGCMHASVMPEEALLRVDAVVVGEAEEMWPRVVGDAVADPLSSRIGDTRPPHIPILVFEMIYIQIMKYKQTVREVRNTREDRGIHKLLKLFLDSIFRDHYIPF